MDMGGRGERSEERGRKGEGEGEGRGRLEHSALKGCFIKSLPSELRKLCGRWGRKSVRPRKDGEHQGIKAF